MSEPKVVLPKGRGSTFEPTYEFRFIEAWSGNAQANNLGTVNGLLADGWEPVRETPFGGGGETHIVSCLLLLRRPRPQGAG